MEVAPARDVDESLIRRVPRLVNQRLRVVEDVGVEYEVLHAEVLDGVAEVLGREEPLPVSRVILDLEDRFRAGADEAQIALDRDARCLRRGDDVRPRRKHYRTSGGGDRVDRRLDRGGVVRPAVACRAVAHDIEDALRAGGCAVAARGRGGGARRAAAGGDAVAVGRAADGVVAVVGRAADDAAAVVVGALGAVGEVVAVAGGGVVGCGALVGAFVAVGVAPPPQAASVRNRRRESAPGAGELLPVMRDPFVSPPTVSYRAGGTPRATAAIIPPRLTMNRRASGASPDISVSHAAVWL